MGERCLSLVQDLHQDSTRTIKLKLECRIHDRANIIAIEIGSGRDTEQSCQVLSGPLSSYGVCQATSGAFLSFIIMDKTKRKRLMYNQTYG